ncbi:sugar ABC transporter substrate-binding protein [Photobacterium gaetbulicola]|uniref:Probable sugar-binding periplasmic protein n=1 Tax=Photobacterium gaetbulicola TaxID=1295392 RepID=A0A0B9G4W8_9GAMM|nr:ABC transporter substrate-binding protein [Photobacterium gaetbulicola]KHT63753.1 sugar ABC transporter substrate-binding protein [Photobacterium gaetbulicola]
MKKVLIAGLISSIFSAHAAQDLQFLHWWTSEGEVNSVEVIKEELGENGFNVVSVPVEGGGGKIAKSILQARAIAGNPPDVAQLEGPSIKSWAALGFLHSINDAAQQHSWDEHLFRVAREIHRYNGEYVAVPVTLHRLNWMWVNHDVLKRYQLATPETWEQVIEVFSQLQAHGVAPLAIGNEPWQIVQLFENIAFGLGGAQYYKKAYIELDAEALSSQTTLEALHLFRQISALVLPYLTKQTWDSATRQLLEGSRAFQITGDWVAGDLMALNGQFPENIGCYPTPAHHPGFIYNMDSLVLFKSPHLKAEVANQVAKSVSTPELISSFNKQKGSVPPYHNASLSGFSSCAIDAYEDFLLAEKQGNLVPSMIDSMAVSPVIEKAAANELFRFFNDPSIRPEDVILHMQSMGASNISL